jgi:hypothetical protein
LVHSFPGAGTESPKVRHPQPVDVFAVAVAVAV